MRLIDIEPYENHKGVTSCSVRQYLSGEGYVSECCTDTRGIPTIDAVPVVYGRWVGTADGYADGVLVYDNWECSACGSDADATDEKPDWNFCPYCGADMRERAAEGPVYTWRGNKRDMKRAWINLQRRCPMRLIKENVKTGELRTICLAEYDGVETHATYWSCDMESCPGLEGFMEAAIMGVEE